MPKISTAWQWTHGQSEDKACRGDRHGAGVPANGPQAGWWRFAARPPTRARPDNVQNVFTVVKSQAFKGQRVLVVDDAMTTVATRKSVGRGEREVRSGGGGGRAAVQRFHGDVAFRRRHFSASAKASPREWSAEVPVT